jgi:ribosomal protein S18 acetylase RimI-like enzyme
MLRMKSMTIRKAAISDLDEIVEMALFLQEHIENCSSSVWKHTDNRKRSLKKQYTEHLLDENSLVLIVEDKTKIIGLLLATVVSRADYLPSIVGSLSSVYVEKTHRRQGIGSMLIREACRFFHSKKAENIYLRYVLGNIEGERFWKHMGFKPILVTAGALTSKIEDRITGK